MCLSAAVMFFLKRPEQKYGFRLFLIVNGYFLIHVMLITSHVINSQVPSEWKPLRGNLKVFLKIISLTFLEQPLVGRFVAILNVSNL